MRPLPFLLVLAALAPAAEVRGAAALLAEAAGPKPVDAAAPAKTGVTKDMVRTFAADPARTAAGWLELRARWEAAEPTPERAEPRDLLDALPPVAAWPEVISGLRALAPPPAAATAAAGTTPAVNQLAVLLGRLTQGEDASGGTDHGPGWALLAACLARDEAARWAVYDAMKDGEDAWRRKNLLQALGATTRDPVRLAQVIDGSGGNEWSNDLELPDLVALFGEAGAEPLLRRALLRPGIDLKVHGQATATLARRLAASIDPLPSRPWSLTCDRAGGPLYERLAAVETATKSRGEWLRQQADGWHIVRLLLAGRQNELQPLIARLGTRLEMFISHLPLDDLDGERPGAVADLLESQVVADPASPLWPTYLRSALGAGRLEHVRGLVDRLRDRLQEAPALIDLLLSLDRVDEAAAALDRRLTAKPNEEDAARLLALGVVLDRAADRAAAIRHLEALVAAPKPARDEDQGWSRNSQDTSRWLAEAGRADLAERLLARGLPPQTAAKSDRQRNAWEGQETLGALVRLYHRLGRHEDVLTILAQARGWQVADAAQLRQGGNLHDGIPPLATVIAESLDAAGRPQDAVAMALVAVAEEPAHDGAWALLARRDPQALATAATALRRQDPLEERPLIWLAQAALDRGDATAAEDLAHQAMDLDPSDGDQGPGDRMRARAVRAEALERLGRKDEAAPLRLAVQAIRTGEEGDRFLRVGLTARAITRWQASEQLLDRTYCVQSRLAVTLLASGDKAGAEAHFRRAYALMPKAFGRRESHCFGCEGVFSGAFAQRIAEPVFREAVAKEPGNAKHHYLLGYLLLVRQRDQEALASLREAVRLDPDYLSAWEQVLSLQDRLGLPPDLARDALLALIRLGRPDDWRWRIRASDDLPALATALAARGTVVRFAPEQVLPLGPTPTEEEREQRRWMSREDSQGLSAHPLLEQVANLLER